MDWQDIAIAFAIAFSVAATLLVMRYPQPLVTDEAYVWYGTLRLLHGEIPQRDFRAYEPGRYLWCALFALVFGRGLGPVRLATHVFYGLCLGVALVTMRGVGLSWIHIVLAALLLASWAHPKYKLFEPGLLFLGFSASTWLAVAPSPLTAALAGGVVGIALLFGFNYFLYLGAAFVLLFVTAAGVASMALPFELFYWGVIGGALGALPFAAFLAIPGFLPAFVERRITSILARGSTNLPLPAPWPWRRPPEGLRGKNRIKHRAFGVLFVVLPAAPVLTLIAAWLAGFVESPREMSLVAAASIGAVTWHHAYSRADREHLAQSMPPLLLMAALAIHSSLALGILFVVMSVITPVIRLGSSKDALPFQFGRHRIWLTQTDHRIAERAEEMSACFLAQGGSFLALPSLIALYPILGRRAPIYDIYCVFPASQREQERMLQSIAEADVRVAFVNDEPLDGREDLRFSKTHPQVWRHLAARMEKVEELPGNVHVFRVRAGEMADGVDVRS